MRLSKEKLPLLMAGIIVLLTIGLLTFIFFRDRSATLLAADKARTDLDTAETIIDLKYPGSWNIREDKLYKGQVCIDDNTVLVDYIEDLLGDTCVIFKNNVSVSTTVQVNGCERAIGVYAPYEVISKVLEPGHCYTGPVELSGKMHQAAYRPLTDEFGQIIGVLFIGCAPHTILDGANKMVGLTGLMLALLVGLFTRFFTARTTTQPLQEDGVVNDRMPTVRQQPILDSLDIANEDPRVLDGGNERSPEQEQAPGYGEEAESEWFDAWLGPQQELPKGLNRITLKQIVLFMKEQAENKVTIPDVSEAVSLSKVTVRHYLDYLAECDLVEIEKQYGSVGRPLRFFKLKL